MKTIKRLVGLTFGALLLTAPAAAETVSIVTTPIGSFSHSTAVAIAKVVSEKTKLRVIVQAQSSQSFIPVSGGTGEFGMGNSFDATFFVTGTGEYEGQKPKTNLRNVGPISIYRVALHVRADSPMKNIKDLRGKRVPSGFSTQKTIARMMRAELANGGLSYDVVESVMAPNIRAAADDFMIGKSDVLFFALGSSAVKQAAAKVGGLRVLEIDDSPEARERMGKVLPGSYVLNIKPAANIEGIAEPTNVLAFDMHMLTREDVPDDVVYQVTKTMYENKPALVSTFKPMNLFDPKRMAKDLKAVPFHPGALKYYKEVGLVK